MAQNLNSGSPAATPAKRLMITLVGGAGLVLLGGGGILLGLNSKLSSLQTVAQQKDTEVASSEQIAHRYQTTLAEFNDTQGRIQFLEASVSPKSYVPTLLQQLQSLAAQTHLTVTSVRPAAPPPPAPPPARSPDGTTPASDTKKVLPPPYDTMNVDVDVIGTYANTSLFLYSLTRFPKIISLDNAQMHPNAAGPAVAGAPPTLPTVTTNLKLTAFMFHDDGTQPAGAAQAPAVQPIGTATAAVGMPPTVGTQASGTQASGTQASGTQASGTQASGTQPGLPYTTIPPASVGTISGAAGRAATGAAAVTRAANARTAGFSTL